MSQEKGWTLNSKIFLKNKVNLRRSKPKIKASLIKYKKKSLNWRKSDDRLRKKKESWTRMRNKPGKKG